MSKKIVVKLTPPQAEALYLLGLSGLDDMENHLHTGTTRADINVAARAVDALSEAMYKGPPFLVREETDHE